MPSCKKKSNKIKNHQIQDSVIIGIQNGNLNVVQDIMCKVGLDFCKSWLEGYALLKTAIKYHQSHIALWLLTKNCKVNRLDTNDTSDTPLHLAVYNNDCIVFTNLLEKGACVNVKNSCGKTPLHISCEMQNALLSKLLLLKDKFVADVLDIHSTTPLHLAVEYECLQTVQLLLEHKVTINAPTIKSKYKGFTPLHIAILKNNEKIVKVLLNNGADINVTVGLSNVNDVFKNDNLLCDINYKDYTPLHLAVQLNNVNMTKLLVQSGANTNAVIDATGIAPLHLAVKNKSTQIITFFSLCNVDFRTKTKMGESIIHLAAQFNWIYLVQVLLVKRANINDQTVEGKTLLHIAVEENNKYLVEMLLKHNANPNIKDIKQQTPLHLAIVNADPFIVNMLLNLHANINIVDGKNETPLVIAVKKNNVEIVHLLLHYYPHLHDKINQSALSFALKNGCSFHQVAESLMKYGFTIQSEELNNTNLLFHLVSNNCCDILEKILEKKTFSLNFKSQYNMLLLNEALAQKNFYVAKLLLKHKCEVNGIDNSKKTPIDYAIKYNDFTMLELLLIHGAKSSNLVQSILTAAKNDNIILIQIFWKYGVDVNIYDEYGTTALHFATWNKNHTFVNLLLQNKAVINTTESLNDFINNDKETDLYIIDLKKQLFMTPLHIAVSKMSINIYSALLEQYANINSKDGYGRTPLHIACAIKSPEQKTTIQTLLRYGADINIFDDLNKLPIYYIYNQTCVCSIGFQNQYDLYNECECDLCEDYFDVITVFIKHVVILESLNQNVHEDNLKFITEFQDLNSLRISSFSEISKMKKMKISDNNFVTYYDLLIKKSNALAAYARNADVVQAFKSSIYINEFPLYSENLEQQFIEAQKREYLLKFAILSFNRILRLSLPEIIVENILNYLKLNDLNNILVAAS